ncbi:serine hydrolase domain-containing protein [Desulfospira joergensenii]|uniref:serine hydrolase domain-containing protein n=1 Tax=Desulfospira joergensenii TaxID=53329 RepID=UPI00041BB5F4|nr:serine hydrolase domain-containing protein [Desulfospira joergensenii]
MENGVRESVFPGGVILVARGKKILFHEAYGMADPKENRRVRKDSIFDLASLTKPLATAALINILVKQGKLGLETRLGEVILEAGSGPKAGITIDMLLRHTSGLPPYREYYRSLIRTGAMSRRDLRNMILKEPLEGSPGKHQNYSDLGYMFLAWVIERLMELRLDRAAARFIYEPLGIRDLFFVELKAREGDGFDKLPVKESGNKLRMVSTQSCPWRGKILTGEVDDDNAWAVGGIEGHAGLFGDAPAIHAFCCEVLDGLHHRSCKVLSPGVLASFVKKYRGQDMVAGFDSPSPSRSSAGRFFSRASVGHLGFTGTSFWIDPESDFIVILLTNRTYPSRANEEIKKFRPKIHDAAALFFL